MITLGTTDLCGVTWLVRETKGSSKWLINSTIYSRPNMRSGHCSLGEHILLQTQVTQVDKNVMKIVC